MPAAPLLNILDGVDSTNNYAMAQVHAGLATNGMAWFAHEQTAGRGQRGKNWESEPGRNIALSLVLEPKESKLGQPFYLSAAVALACQDFFSHYAGEETKIKWPNDLYWRDRKAGGILIENVLQGNEWKYAVIGIGININQVTFDPSLKNPVSLKQITGKDFDAQALAIELYHLLMNQTTAFEPTSFKKTMIRYNQHLYGRNKKIKLKKSNTVFETVVKEVNEYGQLITIDAIERCFEFGEVEWVSLVND